MTRIVFICFLCCNIFFFFGQKNIFAAEEESQTSSNINRVGIFAVEEDDIFFQMLEVEREERRSAEERFEQLEQNFNDYKNSESQREIQLSEHALYYSETLLNWFLAVLAVVGVIAGIVGWKTKRNIENEGRKMAEKAISKIEGEYEQRFQKIEKDVKESAEDADIAIQQSLAQAYMRQEEIEQAKQVYNDLEEKYPKNPYVFKLKGYFLYSLGKYKEAIFCYYKAIKLNPKDWKSLTLIGIAYSDLKNYKKAFSCYDEVIRLRPNDFFSYLNKGLDLADLKKYKEAIECFDEVLKLDPKNCLALYCKGCALVELKKYKEAIECFNKAIEIDSNDASAYFNRSCALTLMNKKKEALENLKKAIELDASFREGAKTQVYLKSLRRLKAFKELVKE